MYSSPERKPLKRTFKFLNKKTTPEWAFLDGINDKSGLKNNIMYTWYREREAGYNPMKEFAENNKVFNMIHSHPTTNGHKDSLEDRKSVLDLRDNKNSKMRDNTSDTQFGIYDRGRKKSSIMMPVVPLRRLIVMVFLSINQKETSK